MTNEQRVKLWDAINDYASACGGDTSSRITSGVRMNAVATVERVLREIEAPIDAEARVLRELNAHSIRERERMAGEIERLSDNGRILSREVRLAIRYASEDRMRTPGVTRLRRQLDRLDRMTVNEDPPHVCPGCYAVGDEPHLSWCIDDEMEREHRHAIETGDYDKADEDDE
jgi:hypothetical protein